MFKKEINSLKEEKSIWIAPFVKYDKPWIYFKQEVKEYLTNHTFNLINLNQLSTVGALFSFLKEDLEKVYSYDAALINIYNLTYEVNPEEDEWPNTQLQTITTFTSTEDGENLIGFINLQLSFFEDKEFEIINIEKVKFIINNKSVSKKNPHNLESELITYFNKVHNFENCSFPTQNKWDDARILDILSLLFQSFQRTFISMYINEIDIRFTNYHEKNTTKKIQPNLNVLFSKSNLLPKIRKMEIIEFPLKIFFDGNIVLSPTLKINEIIFSEQIEWDKDWEFPFNIN